MRKKIRVLLIMAAIGISSFLFDEKVEAASNEPLIKIEKLKMTQVSDRRFATLKKGANVSGKQAFIKEFAKNAKQRKSTFSITCSSWNDVEPDVYDYLDTIDDKKTSDDADFLKGGILELGWSGYTNSNGEAVVNCKLVYTENASQVKKVNSKSKAILKKLKVSGMSDVAKVKVIHDYVVGLVTYDNSLKDHSAYGGLAASKHSTVCQGYALIMYKLLTDAGVPCHYVTGDAGGPHAWNIVKIKGKWYYLDATWDDPSDTTVYDYFLIGSKQLKKDHKTDKYYTSKYKMASSNLNWKSLIKKSKKKDDTKVKTGQTKTVIFLWTSWCQPCIPTSIRKILMDFRMRSWSPSWMHTHMRRSQPSSMHSLKRIRMALLQAWSMHWKVCYKTFRRHVIGIICFFTLSLKAVYFFSGTASSFPFDRVTLKRLMLMICRGFTRWHLWHRRRNSGCSFSRVVTDKLTLNAPPVV